MCNEQPAVGKQLVPAPLESVTGGFNKFQLPPLLNVMTVPVGEGKKGKKGNNEQNENEQKKRKKKEKISTHHTPYNTAPFFKKNEKINT